MRPWINSRNLRPSQRNNFRRHIKSLCSDRGGEYIHIEFIYILKEHGILSQLIALGTSQQNRVAERRNQTLLDMVRSMISFSTLPSSC